MNQKKNLKNGKTIRFSFLALLLCFFVTFTTKVIAQENIINGKITDSQGLSLPGASVLIKGTVKGTETNFDGNYTIKANSNSTLVFSYVGFISKEISVKNQKTINITLLEETGTLDEIVIVGYGSQKKSDVTGAVGQVKTAELNKVVTTNPTEALQGRISGVTVTQSSGSPGAGVDVVIRGLGSYGNNKPLYIIDGVQADPYFIDAKNIASIEVLKDAASGAIYGTKAANGVVIITTKKGKKGDSKVEIETSISINTARKKLKLLDANGYVSVHKQMYENAGEDLPSYVTNPPAVNSDWLDETHRNGELKLLNVRMSGASDNFNYSAGASYADETGMLIGSMFTKKGVYANIGFTKDKFKVNTSLNYSETYREQAKFSLRETSQISPLIPVFDKSKESGYGYKDGQLPDHRNPVGEDHFRNRYTKSKYFLGNINVSYDILNNLTAKANYSVSNLANYTYEFHKAFQIRAAQSDQNKFAFVSEYNTEFRRINQEYTLNYNLEFGKNNFSFLAGYQRISEPFKETYGQAEGWKYSTEDLDGNGDLDDQIPAIILDPDFNTLNAFKDGTYSASGTRSEYRLVSQFGRINYSFDDKYLFQASVRRDGSSRFGKNNKYGTFPSVALGWKITEENFMKNQNLFDFLKLRFSWGQAGNDSSLGRYDYVALIAQGKNRWNGGYVYGNTQTFYQGSIARTLQNDDLKWETSTSSNFGVDFTMLNHALKGSVNYYKTITEDLLIPSIVSLTGGIENPIINVGEFTNKGLEFELGYNNNNNKVGYSASATFSTTNSEVTKLSTPDQVLSGVGLKFGTDHYVNETKIGYEPGAYFLTVADGIFQNQAEIDTHNANSIALHGTDKAMQKDAKPGDIRFIDQNKDGILDAKDKVYKGTAIPKFEYSLNLSADYKGIDFSIFFQGVGGNKIYNGNRFESLGLDAGRNFETEALNAWTPTNTNTSVPRAVLKDPNRNTRASTRFLESGAYLRIKTIQLGYTLPKDVLNNLEIDRLRLYVTGQNLFTITDYSGLDPEVGGAILSRGIDRALYPKYKSVILGVQFQF